ncbi:MAG: flagellar hook-associated protein FlgK [Chloroflexota bacterium]|nr:MAG: flagellar hook-associated protein FlgK [Chloroflexota bacterium]
MARRSRGRYESDHARRCDRLSDRRDRHDASGAPRCAAVGSGGGRKRERAQSTLDDICARHRRPATRRATPRHVADVCRRRRSGAARIRGCPGHASLAVIRSTFATLNLANRALVSQQLALDITAHNIANANNDGFTRQAAEMIASVPFTVVGTTRPQQAAQLGTGVDVANVKRFRDGFVDLQFRQEHQLLGQWEATDSAVSRLEQSLNEPSTDGLAASLSKFWNDWSALANTPESQAGRKALAESALTMTSQMNNLHRTWEGMQRDLDRQVGLRVQDINNLTVRIARLNDQITRVSGAGDQPNDLRDQRDVLIDQLAKIVNLTYTEGSNGAVTINIGGRTAVFSNQAFNLTIQTDPTNPDGFNQVMWEDKFRSDQIPPLALDPVLITSGQLFGDLYGRDTIVAKALEKLQSLGATLITRVNEAHALGFGLNDQTGLPFFDGTGADDITVSEVITGDLDNIAAASSQLAPGDGSNALDIHDIQRELAMDNQSATMEDSYAGLVAEIGILSQQAAGMKANEKLLSSHLSQLRQSIGGVSLDEEATNLMRYQHAFNAAARVVTVVDEMLDRIINNMGIVGR